MGVSHGAGSTIDAGGRRDLLSTWLHVGRLASIRVPPRRLAEIAFALVVLGYGANAAPTIVLYTTGGGRVLSLVLLAAALVLQLGYFNRVARAPRGPMRYLALAALAALIVVPIVLYGPLWRDFPGMLGGDALLVLPAAAGWPVFAVAIVCLVAVQMANILFVAPDTPLSVATFLSSITITAGIAIYGMGTLVRLVIRAEEAREVMRRSAVEQERLRVAGELHELLGQSLSAIALRGELVARLLADNAERARAELTEVLDLARKALVDVRTVVGVRRQLDSSADDEPTSTSPSRASGAPLRPQLGIVLLAVVMLAYLLPEMVPVDQTRGIEAALLLGAVRLVQIALVLHLTTHRAQLGRPQVVIELAVIAALVWAPLPILGPFGHYGEGLLMGAALVVLPVAAGVAVFALGVVSAVAVEFIDPLQGELADRVASAGPKAIVLGLVVWGLATAARLVVELRETWADIRAVAVARERVRLARDVHDLLGFSLSAVALKTELVARLAGVEPERAAAELSELLVLTQRALADVRSVARGDRVLSLVAECDLVEATLTAADVGVSLHNDARVPEGPVGSVLATVLREAATNVLRHSKAEWCQIVVAERGGRAWLEVRNDGAGLGRVGNGAGGGNGLRNMAERIAALGGWIDSGLDQDNTYAVTVEVPLRRGASATRAGRRWAA